MQKPVIMDMNIYMLYILVMKHGLTVSQIYDMCNDRYSNENIQYMWSYGSTIYPYPGPKEEMRIWITRTLIDIPDSGLEIVANLEKLSEFIALHATDKINLTLWDKIFTPINRKFR